MLLPSFLLPAFILCSAPGSPCSRILLSFCFPASQPGHFGLRPPSTSCLVCGALPRALTIIPEVYLSLLPSESTSKLVTELLRLNGDFSNPTLQIPTNMNPVQNSFWQPQLSPWAVPWPWLLCVSKTSLQNSTGLELSSTESLTKLSGFKRLRHK